MIDGKTVLAVIPARGGSKGVPRKNIRQVGGKPLIAWTIEAGIQSKYIDRLILSSDDPEIIAVATSWGCEVPYIRPAELSGDDVPGIEPVLDALRRFPGYDYVVLLQPTSPLRTTMDIDACIAYCVSNRAPACVSVTASDQSPYWMYQLGEHGRLLPILAAERPISRRQDLPATYVVNGAIYVAYCTWLIEAANFLTNETVGFQMPKERSIDIDSELDLEWLTFLFQKGVGAY